MLCVYSLKSLVIELVLFLVGYVSCSELVLEIVLHVDIVLNHLLSLFILIVCFFSH